MNNLVVLVCLESPHAFWHLSDEHVKTLRTAFPFVHFRIATNDTITEYLPDAQVYFGWRFQPEWFRLASSLVWIASPSAGTDHLPIAGAQVAGVTVTRSYGFHGRPMAEHAMGLILGFSRGLFTSSRLQRTQQWWKDDLAEEFFDLASATMAIVGCGSIGTQLAHAARAFGMNVLGVRRKPPATGADPDGITWMRTDDILQAVGSADVVVDLLPATDSTRRFFDLKVFAGFKPGSLFVNLGRASTVDQTALLEALDTGRLRGAALDVTDPRPLPMGHPLRWHPRVVLSPKSAAFSRTYMDDAVAFFADNLRRYLAAAPLNGMVTAPTPPTSAAGG
ncbi:2-hydroxyacid dehydrogenase [Streptomyces hygroscopicus subsp. sporocinereus]|uniref:2-hydroxyacid dehydrogenase n=1 Tax=Streptomyces hygroscopicus TaxID=1912 RepID=A0ABQ3TWS7_STRHY|nr:D-2-hydroxyacid dehydrogenase [Streptomyces hygroscopicus]GHJ27396.1 2-hydroxyacid dehydrogenase [Streptomyces hygroscopicus]